VGFQPGAAPRPSVETPGEIDYRLARQATLAAYRDGRLAAHEVCDAHPELRRAARQCGTPIPGECPVCDEPELVHVSYVFGPRLPAHGRCITAEGELARLARRRGEFSCYVVEVCAHCSWNHLARTYVLSSPAAS
jgi:hypothetical protein